MGGGLLLHTVQRMNFLIFLSFSVFLLSVFFRVLNFWGKPPESIWGTEGPWPMPRGSSGVELGVEANWSRRQVSGPPAPVNCQQNISVNRCRIFPRIVATFNWGADLPHWHWPLATWCAALLRDHRRHWQSELPEKYWGQDGDFKVYIFTTARPTTSGEDEDCSHVSLLKIRSNIQTLDVLFKCFKSNYQ